MIFSEVLSMRRVLMGIILLVVYVVIGIPLINTFLMPLIVDFVNNAGDMLSPSWCSDIYRLDPETGLYNKTTECYSTNLRPVVMFIVQITLYVLVPLSVVMGVFRRAR